ncbi:hypothetical protein ACFQ09_10650 [Massilia norwichensis]|uniref:CHASE2 domain-containing protein n=1 Tax=Massilia norwichensis TaxID=1442366 RepID=A0ABT2A5M4_9BURK|nr:hypothetical protein [Massilia norwichensis]MCS0589405.1 hypothetical protein [Massilia norwichensis]
MNSHPHPPSNPILRAGAYLWQHFKEEFRPILFSAALAIVLAQVGLLSLFTKLSLLVVANLAAPELPGVQADARAPVVLYLDEKRWFDLYREQSPLDRCQMADDLGAILARSPRTLAVDFDLSPGLNDARPECQERLDRLLDQHASRLVLLAPLRVSSQPLFERKRQWTLARCEKGVVFGDGALDESLGIVIDAPGNPYAMASQVHARGKQSICAELAHAEGAETWLRKRVDGDEGHAPHAASHGSPSPVNFSGFARAAAAMPLDDPRLGQIGNWAQRDVFFGGDYGASRDDAFLTPLGKLPGVAVHAALRHSLSEPVDELPHRYGFVVDVLIAFLFSLLIASFWGLYVKLRARPDLRRETSTVVVVSFVLVYLGLVFLLFQIAAGLFERGILIAPLLIALSMLADGFVTGPITAYDHAHRHLHGHTREPEPIVESGFWPLVAVLCMAIGASLVFHHLALQWLSLLALGAVLAERMLSVRAAPVSAAQAVPGPAAAAVLAASNADTPQRHGGVWTDRLGLLVAPASGADWAGLCVFGLRQAMFWAVVIQAMFLILNH